MKILTDMELRARWYGTRPSVFHVEAGTVVTPAARDFLREHGIALVTDDPPATEHKSGFVVAATGETVSRKPEDMTHLYGNVLVEKDHPRIAFRGKLDSLEAKIMETQQIARAEGRPDLCGVLEEVLSFVKQILRSEVRAETLNEIRLMGLDGQTIRHMSHHVEEYFGIAHPTPSFTMGKLCVALNSLRTAVRETELQAVHALDERFVGGKEIVEALNRLSSFVYLMFCGEVTGKRPYREGETGLQGESPRERDGSRHPAGGARIFPNGQDGSRPGPEVGIPVEASGRHVHLTVEAVEALFGTRELTRKSDLSQPGQFVARERVGIVTSKGEFDNVAVLGPARKEVQVELSLTDARLLGINIPVNMSGCLKGAADVILKGPCGIYRASGAAIASKAHIHMTPGDARTWGVEDGDRVRVRLDTSRPVTIDDVAVRVSREFSLAMHLDYDEANACQYQKGDLGYIV